MSNRKPGIFVLLLCLCFLLLPQSVMAASSADAVEPISPGNECLLTAVYRYGETAISRVEVKLYRIAQVSADYQYTLTQSFEASGLVLNGIRTAGEWNVVRATLEAHILACDILPDVAEVTDADGQASFDGLQTGLYLATTGLAEQGDMQYHFDSALIALPGLENDGRWQYQVSVNAKGEELPPVNPDEVVEWKVLKLWKGDSGRNDRPKSVEIEIFRDGSSYRSVILSQENQWTYNWSAKDDGSVWTVVERNVPKGYTVTVEERPGIFVLTNTRVPEGPEDPVDPPKTGDTANILLYVLLMVGSGSMLIILGTAGRKWHV